MANARSDELGIAPLSPDWVQWSGEGGLAWVRGSDPEPSKGKSVIVREVDGEQRAPSASRMKASPSDPRGTLSGAGLAYLIGQWSGASFRAEVTDFRGPPTEVRCGDRSVEGVRWSSDGEALLLLCRRTDVSVDALELWLHRLDPGGRSAVPLVTGLEQQPIGYGARPSIFGAVGWSRAAR